MSTRPELWPTGQSAWHALAAKITQDKKAQAQQEAMDRDWNQPEPMAPEEEEMLF